MKKLLVSSFLLGGHLDSMCRKATCSGYSFRSGNRGKDRKTAEESDTGGEDWSDGVSLQSAS